MFSNYTFCLLALMFVQCLYCYLFDGFLWKQGKNRPRRKPGKQGPGPARRPAGGLTREETHGVRDVADRRHADAPGNPRQVQDLDGKKRSAGSAGDVAQDFELRSLCNVKRIFIKAEHTPTYCSGITIGFSRNKLRCSKHQGSWQMTNKPRDERQQDLVLPRNRQK
jgi:hypothetical protein